VVLLTRLLAGIFGLVFVRAGWRAWTGRWRTWAHPCSEFGIVPLFLLPIGAALFGSAFLDTNGDMPALLLVLFVPVVLVAAPAMVLMTLSLFYTPRRLPGFLRPHWLPESWQAPAFKYVRKPPDPPADPARPGSEDEVAVRFGAKAVLGQWQVWYLDENGSAVQDGMLIPGARWCWLRVFPHAVTVTHERFEDVVQGTNFVLVLQPGEVLDVSLVKRPPIRWIMRTPFHSDRVYLRIRAGTDEHVLAVVDKNFTYRLERNLNLLAGALQTNVQR
jgi:hypothetical protein